MPAHIENYTVGWICAIDTEYVVACELLDEEYTGDDAPRLDSRDQNIYTFGRMGEHNIVIACLPSGRYGITSAAIVGERMRSSFPALRFSLMVGIAGGSPSLDVRLGDVVVSTPTPGYGGTIQYDFGKAIQEHEFEETGHLAAPPEILLNALSKIKTQHKRRGHRISETINEWLQRNPRLKAEYSRPDPMLDRLYKSTYIHSKQDLCDCQTINRGTNAGTIDSLVVREARGPEDDGLYIHYGLIASANRLMKDATVRDALARKYNVLCFEMEAAGLMNNFPYLVIRGICDYSDTHKNDKWQGYAAAVAAAYAKELLSLVPSVQVAHGLQSGNSLSSTVQSLSLFSTPYYMIPAVQNRRFIGREDKLVELEQNLISGETQQLAVYGLGGIGKTQLALAFCHNVKAKYPDYSIFWLSAISSARLKQDFAKLATTCSLSTSGKDVDVISQVKDHLSTIDAGKWLMVVDNVDDKTIIFDDADGDGSVYHKLPKSETGFILFTTRHKDIAVDLTDNNIVNLVEMTSAEAQLFLAKSLGNKDLEDVEEAKILLRKLTHLPLAISQASSYIAKNSITVAKYLALLDDTEAELRLLDRDFRDTTREQGSENAVALTWLVSFRQIQEQDPVAAEILFFLGCVENKAIPLSMLPTSESIEEQTHALGTLIGYSFLSKQGRDDIYDMHRLVHLAVKKWLRTKAVDDEWRSFAMVHLANTFPNERWENRNIWRDYVPHAIKVLLDTAETPSDERADLCMALGQCLYSEGRYYESASWYYQAVSWRDQTLPEEDEKRLRAQYALASAYYVIGRLQDSIEISERVVSIRERILAEDDMSLLQSQHGLAIAYTLGGRVKEGSELLKKLLAAHENAFDKDDPTRLSMELTLAIAYRRDGETKKAVVIMEEIVELAGKTLKYDDPDFCAFQEQLGMAYLSDGRTDKAVEILEKLVAVTTKVFGEGYDIRLGTQQTLACAWEQQGHKRKAIDLMEYVVKIAQETMLVDDLMRQGYEKTLDNMKIRLADEDYDNLFPGHDIETH